MFKQIYGIFDSNTEIDKFHILFILGGKYFNNICYNKSVLNLKIHEKSKKHQINLMSCNYKNCQKGLQGNFKAYCYSNIKMVDPRTFINNMMKTIENKIQEQNWENLK